MEGKVEHLHVTKSNHAKEAVEKLTGDKVTAKH
jgi:hypothetical protein